MPTRRLGGLRTAIVAAFCAVALCSMGAPGGGRDPAVLHIAPTPSYGPTRALPASPRPSVALHAAREGPPGRGGRPGRRARPIPPMPVPAVLEDAPESAPSEAAADSPTEWTDGVREALLRAAARNLSASPVDSDAVGITMRRLAAQWPESHFFNVTPAAEDSVFAELTWLSALLQHATPRLSPRAVVSSYGAIANMFQREHRATAPIRTALLPAFHRLSSRALESDVFVHLSASELVLLLWSCAKLRQYGDPLAVEVVTRLSVMPRMTETLNAKELATLVWASARLRVRSEEMMIEIGRRVVQPLLLAQLDCVGLHTIVWGFAKMGIRRPVLLSYIARQAIQPEMLRTFPAYAVARVLWSFATLQVSDRDIIKPLCDHLKQPAVLGGPGHPIAAVDIARVAWAMARLDYGDTELLDLLAARATAPDVVETFDAQAVCNLLWAYATLGYRDPALPQKLQPVVLRHLVSFDVKAEGAAALAWALARIGYFDKPLLDLLQWYVMYSPGLLAELRGQEVVKLLWAVATFPSHNPAFAETLAAQLRARPHTLPQTSLGLVLLAWALARLDHLDVSLMRTVARRLMEPAMRTQLDSGFVAQMLWAFGRLQMRTPRFYHSMAQRVMELRHEFSALSIANVVWAYSVMGFVHVPMLRSLSARLLVVADDLTPVSLGRVAWGYARLRHYDEQLFTALARRAGTPAVLTRLDAQAVADVVWAFAVFNAQPPMLLEAMEAEMGRRPELLAWKPYSALKVLWALARFRLPDSSLVAKACKRLQAPAAVGALNAKATAKAAWALVQLDVGDAVLMRSLSKHVLKPHVAAALKPRTVSRLAVAFADVPGDYSRLLSAITEKAIVWLQPPAQGSRGRHLYFRTDDLAYLCWALATADRRDDFLMLLVSARTLRARVLAAITLRPLLTLAWAFGRMGIKDQKLRVALEKRASMRDIATLTPEMLQKEVAALHRANVRAPRLVGVVEGWLQGRGPKNLVTAAWLLGRQMGLEATAHNTTAPPAPGA